MKTLEIEGRIDFDRPRADPRLSTAPLFGEARGQMFGILECIDALGEIVLLRAFSGQYTGAWEVDGWVPPLLGVSRFNALVEKGDGQIKALGADIDRLPECEKKTALKRRRKQLSQNLMKAIHGLYAVHNFRGETKSLFDFFPNGIPTGTGDCCAPKLLNAAVRRNLKPLSLAEFYWGKENRSGTRTHGQFYPPCEEKCRPLLGFLLCGIG